MSPVVLVLVYLLLTSGNICQEHGERLQSPFDCLWRIGLFPSFSPLKKKRNLKRNCNHLGAPAFLRRAASVAGWFPPHHSPPPLILEGKMM